jgi:perosamine synthetase
MNHKISVAAPDLRGKEECYVVDAIRSSWISSAGQYVERFESEFADLCGARTSIGVCNGTVALHLALLALDVQAGDEVIVPALTYIATANAVRYVGATPVFVDVDPRTWCLDPERIEEAITPRTKGMIPVHLYGHPADMDEINRIAAANGLWVVEDAAEAPMATYKGRPTGSLAELATFSFYGNKVFTSGEGGALTLSDPGLEIKLRTLKNQGADPRRQYWFPITGYNFRLTNVACAMLCAQLERRADIIQRRRDIFERYRKMLEGTPGVSFQPVAPWAALSPWLFCILVDQPAFGLSRDELSEKLARMGIETRPFFIPLPALPPFQEAARTQGACFEVSQDLASRGLNLPTYSAMADEDVRRVADAVKAAARS